MLRHQYNQEIVERLIIQVEEAINYDSKIYLGWVADSSLQDGTILESGIVAASTSDTPIPFAYTIGELQKFVERCIMRDNEFWVPETMLPGQRVVATTTNEFRPRGTAGTVIDEKSAYYPAVFGVLWDHTGKVSYDTVDHTAKVV